MVSSYTLNVEIEVRVLASDLNTHIGLLHRNRQMQVQILPSHLKLYLFYFISGM